MTLTSKQQAEHVTLPGLLWDQGGLTKDGATRFASLADSVIVTPGPRQKALMQAVGGKTFTTQNPESSEHPSSDDVVVAIKGGAVGPRVAFLGVGAPFDARQWSEELIRALAQNKVEGLVVVVPGPKNGPLTMVPLTEEARTYIPLIQGGIAGALGHSNPGVGPDATAGPTIGSSAAATALESAVGDVALVYATRPHEDSQESQPKPKVGAADVLHVIMKDTGLEVTNRTGMATELRIHLGAPGGEILETKEVFLEPRSSKFFAPGELGNVGLLEPPIAELRQWSHEAEVVYEGGERRIHLVEVRYLAPLPDLKTRDTAELADTTDKTKGGYQVIGTDQFGSPDAVVCGTVSTEISRATRKGTHSMGQRMASLASRQGWREALQGMIHPR